jgi:hypothetical protein
MRCDNSVGDCFTDICELFADLLEFVYNDDTCGSDTEVVFDPSDGCGFTSIRIHMSDVGTAISGLYANKGPGRISSSFLFSRLVNEMKLVCQYFHA